MLIETVCLLTWLLVFVIYAELPSWHITIDTSSLNQLNRNPQSDDYFPAAFGTAEQQLKCSVRYRGATSRTLPKKSWKVKFDDSDNPFSAEKINLNAEYRDVSLMRNYLSFRLIDVMGNPAPHAEFVRLYVNNEFYGVFVLIEELDEHFLQRTGRTTGSIYKARNHGATMAPLIRYDNYAETWDKQIGDKKDYSDLLPFLMRVTYTDDEKFTSDISSFVDIDNFLNYFAVMFVINSFDCFQKNYYLYLNPENGKAELFPWDSDGSFGNNYDGNYWESMVDNLDGHKKSSLNWESLRFNIGFQRLIDIPDINRKFLSKIDNVINDGFIRIHAIIDSTHSEIQSAVYEDTSKKLSGEAFDNEMNRLHSYLDQRKTVLSGNTLFQKKPLHRLYCSTPFPSKDKTVIFRVSASFKQEVYVHYCVNFENQFTQIPLYDDGEHDDGEADDFIYGNAVDFSDVQGGYVPFSFFTPDFYYPANGLSYIHQTKQGSMALNFNNPGVAAGECLHIESVNEFAGENIVAVKNICDTTIDVSYCHLRGKMSWYDVLLPDVTVLRPGEIIHFVSSRDNVEGVSNLGKICPGLFFTINKGDSLHILSPTLSTLVTKTVEEIPSFNEHNRELLINEINYHSSSDHETDDWIELLNIGSDSLDISEYTLKDSDDDHIFTLPAGTRLPPDDYLVLCRDTVAFKSFHPGIDNCIGNFDFGLSGEGDRVRVYANNNYLVDGVSYGVVFPWRSEADGNGKTLELIDPELDNALAASWGVSTQAGGSPGEANKPMPVLPHKNGTVRPQLVEYAVFQTGNFLKIRYSVTKPGNMSLTLFSCDGKKIKTLCNLYKYSGDYTDMIYLSSNEGNLFSYGLYLYELVVCGKCAYGKLNFLR